MNWQSLEAPTWLSDAADDPKECRRQWLVNPLMSQVLPTGRTFDVVSVHYRLGIETLSLLLMESSSSTCCPALVDYASSRVAFLVPVESSDTIRAALREAGAVERVDYRYLGVGGFVVIAGPGAWSGNRYAWVKPPSGSWEELNSAVGDLATQLAAASKTVASARAFGSCQEAGESDD
ncbi:bifunctional DNA primase/polymerase [Embleya sp. NPDC005575]|uniref:bifunctional DNA primase/polymerase n=1 Tax=Embleya sp. NPDC005575 TaxID=3156892 RepID=UPI0033A0C4A0